jgi:hypothetical protein
MQKTKQLNLRIGAIIALVIIGVATASLTMAALSANQNVPSSGTVTASANLGVYSDSGCSVNLTSINWGTLTAGGSTTKTVYVKNTGSGVSLALSMNTTSWIPANANTYITVTWDKETIRLNPNQNTTAIITLTVSPSIVDITNFSTQINIIGTN